MDDSNELAPPPFQVDEKVYCLDKERYYEAIIRKAKFQQNGKQWSFLVHYAGWNDRWDKYVLGDCILKDTAENRVRVQEQWKTVGENNAQLQPVQDGGGGQNNKRCRSTDGFSSSAKIRKRLLSAQRNSSSVADAAALLVYADYCELPFTLKTVLVEELERIQRRLVHVLPAPVPARKVLNHFCKKKIKACNKGELLSSTVSVELIHAFVHGLTQLFQEALPICLLYPQERPQYEALSVKGSATEELVEVYGCEYLLRLFVRLPILLQSGAMRKEFSTWSPSVIGPLLTDLLVLMQKNRQTLFPMTVATAENNNANYQIITADSNAKNAAQPPSPVIEMDTDRS